MADTDLFLWEGGGTALLLRGEDERGNEEAPSQPAAAGSYGIIRRPRATQSVTGAGEVAIPAPFAIAFGGAEVRQVHGAAGSVGLVGPVLGGVGTIVEPVVVLKPAVRPSIAPRPGVAPRAMVAEATPASAPVEAAEAYAAAPEAEAAAPVAEAPPAVLEAPARGQVVTGAASLAIGGWGVGGSGDWSTGRLQWTPEQDEDDMEAILMLLAAR